MPELQHPRAWATLSVALLLVATWLFLRPMPDSADWWFAWLGRLAESDKVLHFAAFTVFAAWFSSITTRRRWPATSAMLLLYGTLIEVAQGAMPTGRSAELLDLVADALGIGLGFLLGAWFGRRTVLAIDAYWGRREQ
ncbi:MAG: VanZ family protein [Gammaproteobacteria bacterium]|nr:VanZ family protein [Gammaproteobacteria bacterium]